MSARNVFRYGRESNALWCGPFRAASTLLCAGLAACGTGDGQAAPPGTSGMPFRMQELAKFDNPWAMVFLPDGGQLVTEKGGTIQLRGADGKIAALSGVPAVKYGGQGGLLDIELAPDFATSKRIYISYSKPVGSGSSLALARATLDQGARALRNVEVIWQDPQGGSGGQFGGIIALAPDGRSLFLTSGERQRFTPAQDMNQPIGKILHLTLDGKPAADNPWAGKAGATTVSVTRPPSDTEEAKGEKGNGFTYSGPNSAPAATWSLGHRNPYGLAFAPDGRLWETEMGPKGGDELNLIEKGRNYGWPLVSEGENYNGVAIPKPATRPDLAPASLFWVPSISPTSLVFYSGRLWPQWKGSAFIGSLSGEALVRATVDGDKAAKADQWNLDMRIRFVTEGPDGALYLLEDGSDGRLLKLTPSG